MSNRKIVILNGTRNGDDYLVSPFSILTDLLEHGNADVNCYHLKDMKLAHCRGCMDCWLKTPGICVMKDEGNEILQAIMQSDMLILFSPVTFGGYSSALKTIVDRFIPLILPFFSKYHGETHHVPRYSHYPRLVGIGIQRNPSKTEAEVFKTLVGRTAIDFHAPSFAAEVFSSGADNEIVIKGIQSTISRTDSLPLKNIVSYFPKTDKKSIENKQGDTRNVLLIVGSPKTKMRSTSDVCGQYLLNIMKSAGWKTDKLTLDREQHKEKMKEELSSVVDRSDLIIFAFPLYISSLPCIMTQALELIADHRKMNEIKKTQSVFAIINNGFPEFYQNAIALAILRSFADQCGIFWAGALAIGAGRVIGQGQELTQPKRSGPPVKHVIKALDKAGDALIKGIPLPSDLQKLISKPLVPMTTFGLWRWLFFNIANQKLQQKALEHGVKKEELFAKPYAD